MYMSWLNSITSGISQPMIGHFSPYDRDNYMNPLPASSTSLSSPSVVSPTTWGYSPNGSKGKRMYTRGYVFS